MSPFLLKGHEDLRAKTNRVMQLFGLVNALMANDRDTLESRDSWHIPTLQRHTVVAQRGHCRLGTTLRGSSISL